MAAGASTKTAINGFGRIGRNVLRVWLKRLGSQHLRTLACSPSVCLSLFQWAHSEVSLTQGAQKPFDLCAINIGSMGVKTAAHLLKYDTVMGTLDAWHKAYVP